MTSRPPGVSIPWNCTPSSTKQKGTPRVKPSSPSSRVPSYHRTGCATDWARSSSGLPTTAVARFVAEHDRLGGAVDASRTGAQRQPKRRVSHDGFRSEPRSLSQKVLVSLGGIRHPDKRAASRDAATAVLAAERVRFKGTDAIARCIEDCAGSWGPVRAHTPCIKSPNAASEPLSTCKIRVGDLKLLSPATSDNIAADASSSLVGSRV